MKLPLALVASASLSVIGCVVDTTGDPTGTPPPSGGSGSGSGSIPGGGIDPGPGTGTTTEAPARISSNTTWTGNVHVANRVTIDPGVALTIAAGSTVNLDASGGFAVSGTVNVKGTSTGKVAFRGTQAGAFWDEITVASTGAFNATYLVQVGGLYNVNGGKLTVVDSQMAHARGDLITMHGGTLDMSYSQIGVEPGQSDDTHCDLHVENAPTLRVTHSTISTSSFGIMFYGGNNADFTYNNWLSNDLDVEPTLGAVSGDFSHSFWAPKAAPKAVGLTVNDVQPMRLTSAGVGAPR